MRADTPLSKRHNKSNKRKECETHFSLERDLDLDRLLRFSFLSRSLSLSLCFLWEQCMASCYMLHRRAQGMPLEPNT